MNDEVKESQQEPEQDSALQTPQPDQPHPPVSDERDDAPDDSPPVEVHVDADEVEVNVDNPAAPADGGDSSSD